MVIPVLSRKNLHAAFCEAYPHRLAMAFSPWSGLESSSCIRDNLTEPDPTYWNEAVQQYNAWVITGSLLSGSSAQTISAPSDTEGVADMLADHLADLYFRSLASAETLIRTTPDPQMDNLAAQVLGLV